MMTALQSSKPLYIHATAVVIGEAGLLIRGPSRAGKSSLALALLAEAGRLSLCGRLIGDDRISVTREGCDLVLRGHPAIQGKIEDRGHGILDVAFVASAIASHVIDLMPSGAPAASPATIRIEGVDLPLMTLPRNLDAADRTAAVMAEVMSLVQKIE
jgi:serine kinase of HPr protein (carbohydrate metabolism regulator)